MAIVQIEKDIFTAFRNYIPRNVGEFSKEIEKQLEGSKLLLCAQEIAKHFSGDIKVRYEETKPPTYLTPPTATSMISSRVIKEKKVKSLVVVTGGDSIEISSRKIEPEIEIEIGQ